MRFINGNWLVQEGYQLHFPTAIYEYVIEEDTLTLYAPCKKIHGRNDTLDGPMLTIQLSSPRPGILRVHTDHFQGACTPQPNFVLKEEKGSVSIEDQSTSITLQTANLTAVINKLTWEIVYYVDDRPVTATREKSLGYVRAVTGKTYIKEELDLGVGEAVYGLGERFTSFVKNGQSIDIWNEDGGTSTQQAYKSIPFYVTNRGYGVFVNHPEKVCFEVASERVSKVQFSVEGESLEYMIIAGPEPKKIVERYTALTGRPTLPPAWSFGLWLTTSFTTDYSEETVTYFVDGMRERDIPLHVFHFDCFWMKEFEWSNFVWNERIFPEPENMLQRLHEKGLHTCLWINPYIAQKSPLFQEGKEKGFLVKRKDGSVWQWDLWQAGMGLVDFTHPGARDWYTSYLRRLLAMGVDSFKTDFGERIPVDVVYDDGSDPHKMHNYYTYLYNKTVFDLLLDVKGEQEAIVFARSATVGGQQFPVHWGGDNSSQYESMAESLRGGLSLSLGGFGFWSHDIGGFENQATPDVYKRWIPFGLLSSHSRLHGNSSYRVPWLFDEEAVDVLRQFVRLKCSLMPYLYEKAFEASTTGVPMMRPMFLEFPQEVGCQGLDRQFMMGDALLVAPVMDPHGEVDVFFPEGRWTHFLTNEVVEGGRWHHFTYDYSNLALFVREGSMIAVGSRDDQPAYQYDENVTLHLFLTAKEEQKEVTIRLPNHEVGAKFRLQSQNGHVTITPIISKFPYQLLVRGEGNLTIGYGATMEKQEFGYRITPEQPDRPVIFSYT